MSLEEIRAGLEEAQAINKRNKQLLKEGKITRGQIIASLQAECDREARSSRPIGFLCEHCGYKNTALVDARFCPRCGTEAKPEEPQEPSEPAFRTLREIHESATI